MSPPASTSSQRDRSSPRPGPLSRLLSGHRDADHGTFDERPSSPSASDSSSYPHPGWLKRAHTTANRAEVAGVKRPWMMYVSYYIPSITWITHYKLEYLLGDCIAGLTLASIYIPMALSLASNLAHLPPIHGMYGFAIQPLVYALLGSCPTMAVGPEAPGSLLMGAAIRTMHEHHAPAFDDEGGKDRDLEAARLAGVITAMTGAIAFIAGVLRLGFLDSVLSRPLLRGFISGVGVVILVEQLIPEMALNHLAAEEGITRSATIIKIIFICRNIPRTHLLTFLVALVSFSIIMVCRVLKKKLEKRWRYIVFLPDRFSVVVLSAVFTYVFRWDQRGLEVLGPVETAEGGVFRIRFPFDVNHLTHAQEALSSAFLISVLGFFESVLAAKALGSSLDDSISSNRELIAFGTANILGGCFQAMPAFGGYGRSKVNKATGGRTPLSSIILSVCTIICVCFLLPYFYYLPRSVLCSMISVVAVSLLEEAPHDIAFFVKIRAWADLATLTLVFVTTLFWNITTGIAIGVGISLINVIRYSTNSRVEILGRVPGTNLFRPLDEDASLDTSGSLLVIKIRESLTFANAGDMSRRLWRIDRYGDTRAHPSLPRLRSAIRGIIFDVSGVGALDGSGAQMLTETVHGYVDRGVEIWFARLPKGRDVWERMHKSGIVDAIGGEERFVSSVDEGLRKAQDIWGDVEV